MMTVQKQNIHQSMFINLYDKPIGSGPAFFLCIFTSFVLVGKGGATESENDCKTRVLNSLVTKFNVII